MSEHRAFKRNSPPIRGWECPGPFHSPVHPLPSADTVSYDAPLTPFGVIISLEITGYDMPWGTAKPGPGMLTRHFLAATSGHSRGPASSMSSPACPDFPTTLPTTAFSRCREDTRESPPRWHPFPWVFHSFFSCQEHLLPTSHAYEPGKRQGFLCLEEMFCHSKSQ